MEIKSPAKKCWINKHAKHNEHLEFITWLSARSPAPSPGLDEFTHERSERNQKDKKLDTLKLIRLHDD